MTATTTVSDPRTRRAFTLVELMVAAGLGAVILVGVLQTYLMIARSGLSLGDYATLEAEARRAIDTAGQDFRMATSVYFNHSESVTLTVPENYTAYGNQVTYALDNSTTGATARCFYSQPGDYSSSAPKRVLARNVTRLEFVRYDRLDAETTSSSNTKRIEMRITAATSGGGRVSASNRVVAATFMLRNKAAN